MDDNRRIDADIRERMNKTAMHISGVFMRRIQEARESGKDPLADVRAAYSEDLVSAIDAVVMTRTVDLILAIAEVFELRQYVAIHEDLYGAPEEGAE